MRVISYIATVLVLPFLFCCWIVDIVSPPVSDSWKKNLSQKRLTANFLYKPAQI